MKKKLLFMAILIGAISFTAQAQKKITAKQTTAPQNTSKTQAKVDATRQAHNQQVIEAKKKNAAAAKSGVLAQKTN